MIPQQFWMGFTAGLVAAYFFTYTLLTDRGKIGHFSLNRRYYEDTINVRNVPDIHELLPKHAERHKLDEVQISSVNNIKFEDEHVHHDDDRVAKDLFKKVRVLCWVMTSPHNLATKGKAVKETWGKRCNVLLFVSSVSDPTFPAIGLNVAEGRNHLTAKTMKAFRYIYEHHANDADWFIKADDDTYVIVENLRYFLSTQNSSQPVYFGQHFHFHTQYNSGGAGYVVSKEALLRFGAKGNDSGLCKQDGGAEDLEFGYCMLNIGVKVGNSTDSLGRSRFHCFVPEMHMEGNYPDWYYTYYVNSAKKGIDGISDYAITFHYITSSNMYVLEFFIYHLRPYGIISGNQDLN